MSTRNKWIVGLALAAVIAAAWILHSPPAAWAQRPSAGLIGPDSLWQEPEKAIDIHLAPDVPLSILSRDVSETTIQILGAVMVIDLRCALEIRNDSSHYLRGLILGVVTQPLSPGGKASVGLPSLNVAPDETVSARVDLRLIRPFPLQSEHAVSVEVDGVLLSNLTFHGPDEFNSRRQLMVWELEADRDRRHFQALLEGGGPNRLETEIRASLDRQALRPRLDARIDLSLASRVRPPTLQSTPEDAGQLVEMAPLTLPDAPLEMVAGRALVDGSRARSPQITVKNLSGKPVRYFEMGWLVRDSQGTSYTAGSVPSPGRGFRLQPGEATSTRTDRAFVFKPKSARSGSDFAISGMSGYVSQVQFEDGSFWIPSRSSLAESELIRSTPVSAEEQRLCMVYSRSGVDAVVRELAKF
jgi:hypothetical protein